MKETVVTPLGTVSPYPKGNKNCPGFLIEQDNDKIMLDCGNGCTRLLDFSKDLDNLKIFISHLHTDHFGDLLSLIPTIYVYKKLGLINNEPEIYIPSDDIINTDTYYNEGWGSIGNVWTNLTEYKLLMNLSSKYGVIIHPFTNLKNFKINNITINTQKVQHSIKTNAFKVETPNGTIVYSADTGPDNNLSEFASNCDLFICESTFLKGQYRTSNDHLYAYEAARIAAIAKVKKLLLTHFWPEIEKEEYLKEVISIFPNTEVAEEGKKLVLRRNNNG